MGGQVKPGLGGRVWLRTCQALGSIHTHRPWNLSSLSPWASFQLTVEMFDYLECELNLFQTGESPPFHVTRALQVTLFPTWSPLGPGASPLSLVTQGRRCPCSPVSGVSVPGGAEALCVSEAGGFSSEQKKHIIGLPPKAQATKTPMTGLTSLAASGLGHSPASPLAHPICRQSWAVTRVTPSRKAPVCCSKAALGDSWASRVVTRSAWTAQDALLCYRGQPATLLRVLGPPDPQLPPVGVSPSPRAGSFPGGQRVMG